MVAEVCFVDCETTGLSAERHEIWEVGLILDGVEWRWFLPVDLRKADPIALDIGGYHQRHPAGNVFWLRAGGGHWKDRMVTEPGDFAYDFANLTHGRHLVGAIVSFDEERLRKLLLSSDQSPSWHYHIIDVEALAVGYLWGRNDDRDGFAVSLPWRSEDLSAAVGVDPAAFEKHTALGDARWAKAIYEKVTG